MENKKKKLALIIDKMPNTRKVIELFFFSLRGGRGNNTSVFMLLKADISYKSVIVFISCLFHNKLLANNWGKLF